MLRRLRHWFLCSRQNVEFVSLVLVGGGRYVETRCRQCGHREVSNHLAGV